MQDWGRKKKKTPLSSKREYIIMKNMPPFRTKVDNGMKFSYVMEEFFH
jgi:hypothetical protein